MIQQHETKTSQFFALHIANIRQYHDHSGLNDLHYSRQSAIKHQTRMPIIIHVTVIKAILSFKYYFSIHCLIFLQQNKIIMLFKFWHTLFPKLN